MVGQAGRPRRGTVGVDLKLNELPDDPASSAFGHNVEADKDPGRLPDEGTAIETALVSRQNLRAVATSSVRPVAFYPSGGSEYLFEG